MKIIGINEGGSCSVVFCHNNQVVFACEEERFSRIKGISNMGIPIQALGFGLQQLGWQTKDVDAVCLSNLQLMTFTADDFYRTYDKQYQQSYQLRLAEGAKRLLRQALPAAVVAFIQQRKAQQIPHQVLLEMGFDGSKIFRYHHHLAHAASAYYGCRRDDSPHLVISLDGGGDGDCIHVYRGEKGRLSLLSKTPYGHSIGNIYSCVTHFMGMKPHEHEYKLMGISAYGKEAYSRPIADQFHQYLGVDTTNPFALKRKIPESTSRIGRRLMKDFQRVRFDNLAAGLQLFTEELLLQWVKAMLQQTQIKKLLLGGGVFMNIKANKRLAEECGLDYLNVMPSCGDETNSFGAAWYHYAQSAQLSSQQSKGWLSSFCLGPSAQFDLGQAQQQFAHQLDFERLAEPHNKVAQLIAEGRIVAYCGGAMEFGARALGNRSILADAENPKIIPTINKMIKNRDFWMPFAPAMLHERAAEYINIPTSLPDSISPFMMHAFDTTDAREQFFSGIHAYDKTARAQVVSQQSNANFYKIIKHFEQLTGKGVVLNTSFNLHGYPIVCGAIDACQVLVASALEYLVVEDYLVTKKELQ